MRKMSINVTPHIIIHIVTDICENPCFFFVFVFFYCFLALNWDVQYFYVCGSDFLLILFIQKIVSTALVVL